MSIGHRNDASQLTIALVLELLGVEMDVVGVQVAGSRSRLGGPFVGEAGGQIEPNTRDDCTE